MRYRLERISATMSRVHLGRSAIGWAREQEPGRWTATASEVTGEGTDASAAFRDLVGKLNDRSARRDGYADAAAARAAYAQRDQQMAEALAGVCAELGIPHRLTMRRRRRR